MARQFKRHFIMWGQILVGVFICSLAYNMFLIPNDIAPGGFTGIAQLIAHGTHWPIGTITLCLNVPLFLLSARTLGLSFGVRSLAATIGLSLMIDWLPLDSVTDDMLLAAVYGGVLSGIGFGLILRGSATTGGTDMLASLVHRMVPTLRVSTGIFLIDGLVIVASAFVFESQSAMYGLIAAFICNVLIEMVLEGPNAAHAYFVISNSADEIARRILTEMDRGVTAFHAMGMYSKTDKKVLLCVVNRFQTLQLRRLVFSVDPRAFVIATRANEVLGEGFRTDGYLPKN